MYLLCKTLCENGVADATGSDLFVVFISNEKKQARRMSLLLIIIIFSLLFLLMFGLVSCWNYISLLTVNFGVSVSMSSIDKLI